MKRFALLLLLTAAAGAPRAAHAVRNPDTGTRPSNILTSLPGAHPRAMGNAFTALADDANALFFNPAGLGGLERAEFTATHRQLYSDISQQNLGVVLPLDLTSAANFRELGSLGIYGGFLDYGRFTGRDAAGTPTGDFEANDRLVGVAYGMALTPRLLLGAAVKHYNLHLADKKVKGVAMDGGLIYRLTPDRLSFGVAATNFGQSFSFASEEEDLPLAIAGGLAFTPDDRFTLTADVVDPKDDSVGYRVGAEAAVGRVIALRVGYDSTYDPGPGVSAGVALHADRLELAFFPIQRFTLDYAFVASDDLEDVHTVSLTFRFGDR